MAYNPTSNLLDFDDMFLSNDASSSLISPTATTDLSTNTFYAPDPLDLEDNKASLLDSLVINDANDFKS